jgi:hypothetical protein
MVRSVILISRSGMDAWWRGTALGRADLLIIPAQSYSEGYRLVVSGRRDLVVAEDWPGAEGFLGFVGELTTALDQQSFKVLLLTNQLQPGQMGRPVCDVLRTPCTPEEVNAKVVAALDLIPRASQRHLVRLHVGVDHPAQVEYATAVTLQVNAGGMLVECTEHLPTEREFSFSFHGVKELEGFLIPGRILRREGAAQLSRIFRYVVAFDAEAKAQRLRLAQYLDGRA